MIFVPEGRLSPEIEYSVELTGVKDPSGNLVAGPVAWSFTTTRGGWAVRAPLEQENAKGATELSVWNGKDGRAAASWTMMECPAGCTLDRAPWVAFYRNGAWSAGEEVPAAGYFISPRVVVDSQGIATVVFYGDQTGPASIYAIRRDAAGTWGALERLDTSDEGHAQFPRISLDGAGTVYVAWQQDEPIPPRPNGGWRTNLWANRFVVGRGWSGAQLLETANESAGTPDIAVQADGTAIVAWTQGGSTWFSKFAANAWSPRQPIGLGLLPKLVPLADGRMFVAMTSNESSVVSYTYDGSWGGVARAAALPGGLSPFNLDVDVGPDGTAVAAFRDNATGGTSGYQTVYDPGARTWTPPTLLETTASGSGSANVAMGRDKLAVATWVQSVSLQEEAYLWSNSLSSSGWGSPQIVDTNVGNVSESAVFYDPAQNSFNAVWLVGGGQGTANQVSVYTSILE